MTNADKEKESPQGAEKINPYDDTRAKSDQVEEMFDSIAPAYDFMNNAMSFGMHGMWRTKALNAAAKTPAGANPADILDIATGTGEVVFELHRRYPSAHITGVDLSEGMLKIADKKLKNADETAKKLIKFRKGDSLALEAPDASYDLITVAYGVRNFERLAQGYREMWRVLRPGGTLCVIELSEPASAPMRALYRLYARTFIPFVGRIVSGDTRAYTYLPESIAAAPQRNDMTDMMREAGFKEARWKSLTFGAVTYYIARK